jgi:Lipopolysaccharide kinase (Kdo/WaaP) family
MGSLVCIEQGGWRLAVEDSLARAPGVIRAALELADSTRLPFRRSRHASTFLLCSPSGREDADLFVKHFDPPAGWERLKSYSRRSRSSRTARISAALRAAGFSVPPLLLQGVHSETQRELIVTARAEGDGPILALRALGGSVAAKRAVLRALGGEVGRLHLAGFIHGDLTPFNIRIMFGELPRFTFIDNDRTQRNVLIARARRRLRNLVQLGRFALPGITRTDRMRVFRAYEATLHRRHSRSLERKVAAMLRRRTQRTRAS